MTGGTHAFRETTDAYTNDLEAAVQQRRIEIDAAWNCVDRGWTELEKRMVAVGVAPVTSAEDSMLRLNVGGSHVNVWRSALSRAPGVEGSTLAALFEGQWDHRLPRDVNGRVVLDESPSCFKYMIKSFVENPRTAAAVCGNTDINDMPPSPESLKPHDEPYFWHMLHFLGLDMKDPRGMALDGGSTTMGPVERKPFLRVLRTWCPGGALELVYRASRDGYLPFNFHAKCGRLLPTLTLVRVTPGEPGSTADTVVGGYSINPWAPPSKSNGQHGYRCSPTAFVLMLKDGSQAGADRKSHFQHAKWDIRPASKTVDHRNNANYCSTTQGPSFGIDDLHVMLKGVNSTLSTGSTTYNIRGDSSAAFLGLDGNPVVDVEVFSVSPTATALLPTPPTTYIDTSSQFATARLNVTADEIHTFGESIAYSLAREQGTLEDAQAELVLAKAKVAAAIKAFEVVYGPEMGPDVQDTVIELSVRGKAMTVLRSTLQVCPDSALAVRFTEDRWPANGQDTNAEGRRVVDCNPACFAKLLDVLRMRKRALWARKKCADAEGVENDGESERYGDVVRAAANCKVDGEEEPRSNGEEKQVKQENEHYSQELRVIVSKRERACFDEFVNMQFPGCEDFVTDLVEPP